MDEPPGAPPTTYSSITNEYEALHTGAALLDRSYVGRLSLTGEDALDLLNRLSTNELMALDVGQGIPTVLTSNKGRIIDLLFVHRLPDHLLVVTSPRNSQKVAGWIDFYTFVEDVTVKDVTDETTMLSVIGPRASSFLEAFTHKDIVSVGRYESVSASIASIDTTIVRTDFLQLPGYELVASADDGPRLWEAMLKAGKANGAMPVGTAALEAARVEQGIPAYGKELSEDFNPLEANLLEFISFTKGCYVGQEVVTRLNTYKKVQKHLVALQWNSDDNPAASAKVMLEGKPVGVITSPARPPGLKGGIGLGYVRKEQSRPGTELEIEGPDGEFAAVVAKLPFK